MARMASLRVSDAYQPTGDQPQAIVSLSEKVLAGDRYQTPLGANGTGKTATMAWIVEQVQKPTLVIAQNRTLAAQLCNQFRESRPLGGGRYHGRDAAGKSEALRAFVRHGAR
jgi:excinuclease ABC subunit B